MSYFNVASFSYIYFPNYKVILSFGALVTEGRPGYVHKAMCLHVYAHAHAHMYACCMADMCTCMGMCVQACVWGLGNVCCVSKRACVRALHACWPPVLREYHDTVWVMTAWNVCNIWATWCVIRSLGPPQGWHCVAFESSAFWRPFCGNGNVLSVLSRRSRRPRVSVELLNVACQTQKLGFNWAPVAHGYPVYEIAQF